MEKIAFKAFLEGLGDHINYAVRTKRPKDLEKALDEALHEEMLQKWYASRRATPTALAFVAGKEDSSQGTSNFQGVCHHCQQPGHMYRNCHKRTAQTKGIKTPSQNSVVAHMSESQLQEENRTLKAQVEDLVGRLERFQPGFDDSSGSRICSLAWPRSKCFTYEDAAPQQNSILRLNSYITTHIPIKANKVPYSALVDTGSSITVAPEEMMKGLRIGKLLPMQNSQAIGVGGQTVNMVGSAVVQFVIGAHMVNHPVCFIAGHCMPEIDGEYRFIIGNDMLSKLPTFHFNYKDALFHIGDDTLPLGQNFGKSLKTINNLEISEEDVQVAENGETLCQI